MNQFSVADWQETDLYPIAGEMKVAQAAVKQDYQGRLSGSGQVTYLITYNPGSGSTYVGTEHFHGTLDGVEGQWVFEHKGGFVDGQLTGTIDIIAATTGDDVGKRVSYQAPLGQSVSYAFD